MSLQLSLSSEAEEMLRRQAKAAGVSPEEFARRILEASLHVPAASESRTGEAARRVDELFGPGSLTPEESQRRLQHLERWFAMAEPNEPGTFVDDSRDSIYDGRGE